MIYDFRTMTKKDLFKAKLGNKVIDFGHVPTWRLRAFAKFCIKHGLIHQPTGYMHGAYKVIHEYKYTCIGSNVSHLPLGWAFILWHEIVGYKDLQQKQSTTKRLYTHVSNIHVRPRGTRPGYDYVTYYQGIVN